MPQDRRQHRAQVNTHSSRVLAPNCRQTTSLLSTTIAFEMSYLKK